MAVTTALLVSCRVDILRSPEYTAFAAAYASYAAATRATRLAYWQACFGDNQAGLSPAFRLRKLIRETVAALADATVTRAERESAYQTLVAAHAPRPARPSTPAEEAVILADAITEDQLS